MSLFLCDVGWGGNVASRAPPGLAKLGFVSPANTPHKPSKETHVPERHRFQQHAVVLGHECAVQGNRGSRADRHGARRLRTERRRPRLQRFHAFVHITKVHARDVVRPADSPRVLFRFGEIEVVVRRRALRGVRQDGAWFDRPFDWQTPRSWSPCGGGTRRASAKHRV